MQGSAGEQPHGFSGAVRGVAEPGEGDRVGGEAAEVVKVAAPGEAVEVYGTEAGDRREPEDGDRTAVRTGVRAASERQDLDGKQAVLPGQPREPLQLAAHHLRAANPLAQRGLPITMSSSSPAPSAAAARYASSPNRAIANCSISRASIPGVPCFSVDHTSVPEGPPPWFQGRMPCSAYQASFASQSAR